SYFFADGTRKATQHPGEHDLVQRPHAIPISQPPQSERIERRYLAQQRPVSIRLHFEFQPRPPWKFHLGSQSQPLARLDEFDVRTIQRVAHWQPLPITATTTHSHSPDEQVQPATQSPKPVCIMPAFLAANALEGGKHFCR